MADLKPDDKKRLEEAGFNPDELSDQEANELLRDLYEEDTRQAGTAPAAKSGAGMAYFRCAAIPALSLHTAPAGANEVAPHKERFVPFYEKWQGDTRKVGYLATDNARAIELARKDPRVEEIDKKEYDKCTDIKKKDVHRAPY